MVLCLLIAALASATAQARPDVSGEWVLLNGSGPGSDAAHALTVVASVDGFLQFLEIVKRSKGDVRSETYQIGIAGGTVGGISLNANGEPSAPTARTEHSTKWDGSTLVIWRSSYSGPTRDSGPCTEHHEVWSLDDGAG
jgi:hypothetical protein